MALAVQVCGAVRYMHELGLIHRDIKAENVFYTGGPGDAVLLGDFGFATRVERLDQQLNTFCGSPPYAAPELFVVRTPTISDMLNVTYIPPWPSVLFDDY